MFTGLTWFLRILTKVYSIAMKILILSKKTCLLFEHLQVKPKSLFKFLQVFVNINNCTSAILVSCVFRLSYNWTFHNFLICIHISTKLATQQDHIQNYIPVPSTSTACISSLCYDRYFIYQNEAVVQLTQFS